MLDLLQAAIPSLVFLLMFLVGLSLELAEFTRLRAHRRGLVLIVAAQLVLLPALAWVLIHGFAPAEHIAAGLFLVAICPGGAISNAYSLLAGANMALSVSLTTVSTLLALIVMPLLLLTVFPGLVADRSVLGVIIERQVLQLFLSLLLPLMLGVLVRRGFPGFVARYRPLLERLSGGAVLALVLAILIQFRQQLEQQFSELLLIALVFSLLSLLLGRLCAMLISADLASKAAVTIEFPVRNLALTAMVATQLLGDMAYMLFAAVFFVVQTPLIALVIAYYRRQFRALDSRGELASS